MLVSLGLVVAVGSVWGFTDSLPRSLMGPMFSAALRRCSRSGALQTGRGCSSQSRRHQGGHGRSGGGGAGGLGQVVMSGTTLASLARVEGSAGPLSAVVLLPAA